MLCYMHIYFTFGWVGYEIFFTNLIPSYNFAQSASVKPTVDYIGMKISALLLTQLFFYCHRANNSTKKLTNTSRV